MIRRFVRVLQSFVFRISYFVFPIANLISPFQRFFGFLTITLIFSDHWISLLRNQISKITIHKVTNDRYALVILAILLMLHTVCLAHSLLGKSNRCEHRYSCNLRFELLFESFESFMFSLSLLSTATAKRSLRSAICYFILVSVFFIPISFAICVVAST